MIKRLCFCVLFVIILKLQSVISAVQNGTSSEDILHVITEEQQQGDSPPHVPPSPQQQQPQQPQQQTSGAAAAESSSPELRAALHRLQGVLSNMNHFSRTLRDLEDVLQQISQDVSHTIESITASKDHQQQQQLNSPADEEIKMKKKISLEMQNEIKAEKLRKSASNRAGKSKINSLESNSVSSSEERRAREKGWWLYSGRHHAKYSEKYRQFLQNTRVNFVHSQY